MSEQIIYPVSRPTLTGNELKYVTDAMQTGWISSMGKYVTQFEEDFARYCGVRHAITVCNGTAALHLALAAYEIGAGDEVIVPDLSFVATANAVLMTGAKPVFCDIDPVTLCIDPGQLERHVTAATRAIIPVHLYGHPAAMDAIKTFAEPRGLKVIEDSAEAHGATLYGKRVGALGDCATFSFYANKNMTTGEGGMITTDDDAFAARCRHLRDHAMTPQRRYWHDMVGYNYRMTNIQAAIGCAQLEQLDTFLAKRVALFEAYQDRLAGVEGISLNRTMRGATNAYWMICLELQEGDRTQRDHLIQCLKVEGVDTRPYFYPMSMLPYLPGADTPVSHAVSARGLNLPSAADLNENDVGRICEILKHQLSETRNLSLSAL